MFTLRYNKSPGEMIPAWYGIAYRDMYRQWDVCYPIPLNHVVGILRNIHWRLACKQTDFERATYLEGWNAGYHSLAGELEGRFHEGYKKGKMEASREIDTLHKKLAELKIAIEGLNA